MTDWLFPDFLAGQDTWTEAHNYWTDLWKGILQSASSASPWESPWMKNQCLDGNPIFTAICREERRGVRVIQQTPPAPDEIEIDFWIDTFGDKSEPDAITELVIACCPSRSNVVQIEQMLREWVESGKITFAYPTVTWPAITDSQRKP